MFIIRQCTPQPGKELMFTRETYQVTSQPFTQRVSMGVGVPSANSVAKFPPEIVSQGMKCNAKNRELTVKAPGKDPKRSL